MGKISQGPSGGGIPPGKLAQLWPCPGTADSRKALGQQRNLRTCTGNDHRDHEASCWKSPPNGFMEVTMAMCPGLGSKWLDCYDGSLMPPGLCPWCPPFPHDTTHGSHWTNQLQPMCMDWRGENRDLLSTRVPVFRGQKDYLQSAYSEPTRPPPMRSHLNSHWQPQQVCVCPLSWFKW